MLTTLESTGWLLVGFSETGGRITLWQRLLAKEGCWGSSLLRTGERAAIKLPFPTLADPGGLGCRGETAPSGLICAILFFALVWLGRGQTRVPGADGLRLTSSGPVGPGAYPGLGWPGSGPKALQARWCKAGASRYSPAPSPVTPRPALIPDSRQYSPPCRPMTKGPARCGPQQQVCVKAMWRPTDCSVLNQLTSPALSPSLSLAQPRTNHVAWWGPVYLNKLLPIDTSAGPLSVASAGWEEGEAVGPESEAVTGPSLSSRGHCCTSQTWPDLSPSPSLSGGRREDGVHNEAQRPGQE